jgi:hypothetical protein
MRQAGSKCGNCRFFVARNVEEAKLATYAKNEAECAPGEWVFAGKRKVGCHGGPVYGQCAKWRERGASSPRVASTFWCKLWQAGGPTLRRAGGSVNRPAEVLSEAVTPVRVTLGAVAALAVASFARRWRG